MDFALSEEQEVLQSTLNDFLQEQVPLSKVRELAAADTTHSATIAQGLTELGIPAILVPEEYGGVGLHLLDAAIVAECLGYHVVPNAFLANAVMAVYALQLATEESIKGVWLPRIAAGESQIAVALADFTGQRDSQGISAHGSTLTGQTMFAIDIEAADAVIVADNTSNLHLVEIEDVIVEPLRSVDKTRSIGELKFESTPSTVIASGHPTIHRVIAAGRAVLAADTLGAAQAMLDQAIAYAGERKQFNRVIGSFQAVKHLCAEMAADLEPCRSLVWYAAHSDAALPEEAQLMTNHAKAHLAEIGRSVARKATEVHGGMGFTDLLGLHYWFKRIELNRQLLGTPNYIRREIAQLQEWK